MKRQNRNTKRGKSSHTTRIFLIQITLLITCIAGAASAYATLLTSADFIAGAGRKRQAELEQPENQNPGVRPSEANNDRAERVTRSRQARQDEIGRNEENTNPLDESPPDEPTEGITAPERPPAGFTPATQSDDEDWMLILINTENRLPDNYMPNLKSLDNGLQFDERAIDRLNAMLSAMKNQGLSPVVCSAYRSVEYQRTLFNNNVSQLVAAGFSQAQAETETSKSIAYPGSSEHNSGLAVDIVSLGYQLLDDNQANTPEIIWLFEHCAEYGFILRYPRDKMHITGITYEPWHFRYVGAKAAQEIMNDGLCLEEYLQ